MSIEHNKTHGGLDLVDYSYFAYEGNQLSWVSESAAGNNAFGSFGYKKYGGSGYKYNENGSLVADKSRCIAYITYDFNNNPKQIYFTNGSVTKYVYSAAGQKLRTVNYTAKPNITRAWGTKPEELTAAQILQADSTDYLLGGSLVMKNGKIDKFLFDGGYAKASVASPTTENFAFYYFNQDHLGNNREVVDANGTVRQVTNYYPFGTPYADATAAKGAGFQPYKYNGKELDQMQGLNTYDYGARQYDPALARWDRVDPLCEKYYGISPYTYCGNNPMNCIDLHGDSITMDYKSMLAIYRGLKAGYNLNMDFHSGVLNPSSIAFQAKYSDDSFLQNLYEIAKNPQMVVLRVTDNNIYKMQGMLQEEKWNKPEDFDVEQSGWSDATISEAIRQGIPKGKTINGNLGQTLYPNKALKTSIGGTIEININSKGSPIHQTVGISHEFAHVVRFLKGLPHSHSDAGAFIYGCQWDVMKRFGYDYLDVNIFGVNYSK